MAPLDSIEPPVGRAERARQHKETHMLVTMIEDRTAALDGINTTALSAGEIHDLPASLAQRYIELGAAQAVTAEAPIDEPAGERADDDSESATGEEQSQETEPEAAAENTDDSSEKAQDPPLEDRAAEPPSESKPAPATRARRGRK